MYEQTKTGGEEQAIALLSGDSEENKSLSHSTWLLLRVLVCTFAFVMLASSLGFCAVYRHQYGEHKERSLQIKEHAVDRCGGFNRLLTAKQLPAVEPGNVEMFSSHIHISMPNEAVLKGTSEELRRKLHLRSRAKMSSFLGIVEDLLHENLLKLHHKTLCLDFHADREVVALRAKGFKDARGINMQPVLLNSKHRHENLQIKKLADQKFDFFFTSMFDYIPHPALFVAEIEQTLKVGGLAAMHVSLNKWRNKYITSEPGRGIKPVTLLFQHSEIVYVSSVAAPGLDTIIVFKKTLQAKAVQVYEKEMKKKQVRDDPLKPQSVKKPVELSSNQKCRKYAEEQQMKSRRHTAMVQGSLPYTSMLGTFLPSATHFSGKIVSKLSMLTALPGASNLNTIFVEGLRNVAQLGRAIVQDSFSVSKEHGKVR